MKYFQSISVSEQSTPTDLYQAICQFRPSGRKQGFFFVEAHPADEISARIVRQVLYMCQERGLKQTRGHTRGAYEYAAARIYDPEDLRAAALLVLGGGRGFLRDVIRNERGTLVVPASQATPSLRLKATFPQPWIIISDAVREVFASQAPCGCEFLAVRGTSTKTAKRPLWELTSNVTLPKMVNSVLLDTSPHPRYGIDDDSYQTPEIHYRERDLHAMPCFDIARTLEPLGAGERTLIISQKFYCCCLEHRIPVIVWPVRIDND